MGRQKRRVAILFPADPLLGLETDLHQSRHAETAAALASVGVEVIGAPFADPYAENVRARLLTVDSVLVWFNPIEAGRDRHVLNGVLRDVASKGVFVSTHPDVIDRIGTKEVLYRTRHMGWGCDTRLYATPDAMHAELPASLAAGGSRVLKQIRGQSGEGIWQVTLAEECREPSVVPPGEAIVRVRHAKRGSPEEIMPLAAFVDRCRIYFEGNGAMIDQAFQPRLTEGMIRCYLVGARVEGFGEQLVNMLYPAPSGISSDQAPLPGTRLYYPPTRGDFQALKERLENQWVHELCAAAELTESQLPVLWDADFLYGLKDAYGADTYVLCEINVSSVHPFPPSALGALVKETISRLSGA